MKAVILSQNDPFYTKFFFKEYIKRYSESPFELQAVYLLDPMKDSLFGLLKRTLSFYGPFDFLRMGIKYVFAKIQEKIGVGDSPLTQLQRLGITVEKVKNVNDKAFVDVIRSYKTDFLISVSCPQIFSRDLLSTAKIAPINIHSGKIPLYRGFFPNFWQMLNGEKFATVTIHKMEPKVDKGNIILEMPIEIKPNMTLQELIKQTKEIAVEGVFEVVKRYKQKKIILFENEDLKDNYYGFPSRKDVLLFKQKGLKIL